MILTIDRGSTRKGFYSFSFGVDYDICIFQDSFYIPSIDKQVMHQIDDIITTSHSLLKCVLNIKHPLLLQNNNIIESSSITVLRDYFAIRLIHRRFNVELIEIGKRLIKD